MGGHKIYHAFDMQNAYHCLEIAEEDQDKTAIVLPDNLGLPARQYNFKRLSFGLSAAPGVFQYIADRIAFPAKQKTPENDLGPTVSVFLDDFAIAGTNFAEMRQRLIAFFNRIRAAGVLLKAKKSAIFQDKIDYLGHSLDERGISMHRDKLDRILHWPPPQNVKELRSYLGFINYYSPFIKNFSRHCQPFYALLHKNVEFNWDSRCQENFEYFKKLVTSAPILGVPKPDKGPFILTTDGSLTGLGACLRQVQDDKEVTISFWSKTLNAAQRNYCITHIELLAVVEAIQAFSYYLLAKPWILESDHISLKWLTSMKILRGRLARWLEILSAYKFTVRHVPGVSIPHVDALSRIPNRPCDPNCPTCTRIERKEAETLETKFALVKWTTISPADGISTEQMARDQYEDTDIKPLIDALLSEHRPLLQAVIGRSSTTRALWHQFSSLILLNKVLYRKFEHTSGKPELIRYQLILPEKHTTKTVKSQWYRLWSPLW